MNNNLETRRKIAKAKLCATAILAEGGDRLSASILFHESVRLERESLSEEDSPQRHLASTVERCWCLLDGLDPFEAAREWVIIQSLIPQVSNSREYVRRLQPRYKREYRAFSEAINSSTLANRNARQHSLIPETRDATVIELREVRVLLDSWIGVAPLWWVAHRLEQSLRNHEQAWTALKHAHQLAPDSPAYSGMLVQLASDNLDEDETRSFLRNMSKGIENANHVLVLQYVLAELRLVQRQSLPSRPLEEVLRMARSSLQHETHERSTKLLQATVFLIDARLEGKRPSFDILRRADLADLIPETSHENEHVSENSVDEMIDHLLALAEVETRAMVASQESLRAG